MFPLIMAVIESVCGGITWDSTISICWGNVSMLSLLTSSIEDV